MQHWGCSYIPKEWCFGASLVRFWRADFSKVIKTEGFEMSHSSPQESESDGNFLQLMVLTPKPGSAAHIVDFIWMKHSCKTGWRGNHGLELQPSRTVFSANIWLQIVYAFWVAFPFSSSVSSLDVFNSCREQFMLHRHLLGTRRSICWVPNKSQKSTEEEHSLQLYQLLCTLPPEHLEPDQPGCQFQVYLGILPKYHLWSQRYPEETCSAVKTSTSAPLAVFVLPLRAYRKSSETLGNLCMT